MISISDSRMDLKGNLEAPANPLPLRCPRCRFVDIDFVPQPYVLCKGMENPADLSGAEVGNFLVRERLRQILDVVVPGQCDFFSTIHAKTKEPTPWFLAVPKHLVQTGRAKDSIKRCPDCGEPGSLHGTQYEDDGLGFWTFPSSPFDVFKTLNWISTAAKAPDYTKDWVQKYIDHRHALSLARYFFFSVRLHLLLKRLGIRGYYPSSSSLPIKSTNSDIIWVEEKLRLIESLQIIPVTESNAETWFADYLTKKEKKKRKAIDFDSVEQTHGLKLPATYKEFISRVGSKTFRNMDGEEGLNVQILPPEELDFEMLRKDRRKPAETDENDAIDAVVFAATEFGDLLCFDVSQKDTDYPVYIYQHEMDDFEPFTKNFAACVKRLTKE